jgi:hypothetical protein
LDEKTAVNPLRKKWSNFLAFFLPEKGGGEDKKTNSQSLNFFFKTKTGIFVYPPQTKKKKAKKGRTFFLK